MAPEACMCIRLTLARAVCIMTLEPFLGIPQTLTYAVLTMEPHRQCFTMVQQSHLGSITIPGPVLFWTVKRKAQRVQPNERSCARTRDMQLFKNVAMCEGAR